MLVKQPIALGASVGKDGPPGQAVVARHVAPSVLVATDIDMLVSERLRAGRGRRHHHQRPDDVSGLVFYHRTRRKGRGRTGEQVFSARERGTCVRHPSA